MSANSRTMFGVVSLVHYYLKDGYEYATDGYCAIRVFSDNPNTPGRFPQLSRKFCPTAGDNLPWPDREPIEDEVRCDKCNGNGDVGAVTCTACGGTGTEVCDHCQSEIDCSECDGGGATGGTICEQCNGKGRHMAPAYQQVGACKIALKYDALVRQLPNPRYIATERMCRIVFDGGQAAVMGVLG